MSTSANQSPDPAAEHLQLLIAVLTFTGRLDIPVEALRRARAGETALSTPDPIPAGQGQTIRLMAHDRATGLPLGPEEHLRLDTHKSVVEYHVTEPPTGVDCVEEPDGSQWVRFKDGGPWMGSATLTWEELTRRHPVLFAVGTYLRLYGEAEDARAK